jgi:hypothetical protein
MLTIEKVDPNNKDQINRFVAIPFRLYKNCPQWVPPFYSDVKIMLNPVKHPFYEHSEAESFIAVKDGRDVGRITALVNKPFNKVHGTKDGEFYLFECENDQEAADALFNRAFEWARVRGLNRIVGPKGFSAFDGYGIQIEGNDKRQMMTMMNYNYPYYRQLVENMGFEKEVDFVSCHLNADKFILPEKARRVADRVIEKGTFKVLQFTNKAQIRAWANRIGVAYNKTFINNWEYYPFSEREIKYVVDTLIQVVDPKLVKIITHNDEVVGFLIGFADVSGASQRAKGHLNPISIADMLIDMKRTKWVSLNGAGMLPEYHGLGGNALLYSEMEKTLHQYQFVDAELTQVAETAVQMRKDLINVGGEAYKNHRVYRRMI